MLIFNIFILHIQHFKNNFIKVSDPLAHYYSQQGEKISLTVANNSSKDGQFFVFYLFFLHNGNFCLHHQIKPMKPKCYRFNSFRSQMFTLTITKIYIRWTKHNLLICYNSAPIQLMHFRPTIGKNWSEYQICCCRRA